MPGGIPDALERRTILYGTEHKKAPDYEAYGDMYHEVGRLPDALECYERITDEGKRALKIKELRAEALESGDHFLLNRIDMVGDALSADEWLQAAEKAEAAGKLRYALKSARRAGNEALVQKLEDQLGIDKPVLPELEGEESPTNEAPPPSEGGEASEEPSDESDA